MRCLAPVDRQHDERQRGVGSGPARNPWLPRPGTSHTPSPPSPDLPFRAHYAACGRSACRCRAGSAAARRVRATAVVDCIEAALESHDAAVAEVQPCGTSGRLAADEYARGQRSQPLAATRGPGLVGHPQPVMQQELAHAMAVAYPVKASGLTRTDQIPERLDVLSSSAPAASAAPRARPRPNRVAACARPAANRLTAPKRIEAAGTSSPTCTVADSLFSIMAGDLRMCGPTPATREDARAPTTVVLRSGGAAALTASYLARELYDVRRGVPLCSSLQ